MKNGSHRIQHADAAASDGRTDSRLDTRAIGRLEQFSISPLSLRLRMVGARVSDRQHP